MALKRITIKEVAEAAGVSTQTVSRVINDRPDVAPDTRQRVLAVIDRLGFQPSALARSLIRQISHTIGVVTAGLKYIGPSQTLTGIAEQSETLGYSLLLKELRRFDTLDAGPILRELLAHQVDGILWAVPEMGANHDWVQSPLAQRPVPIVFVTMHPVAGQAIVGVDNFGGGRLATEHLIAQGRRRIGHIAGPATWWEACQRRAGWQSALTGAGLPAELRQVVEGDWNSASGERAFRRLLDQFSELDAVFAANDQMALSVLLVANRSGRRVPEDLAVVGFDGIPESAYFTPPLTTIQQDSQELGRTAVRQIVRMIQAGHDSADGRETIWIQPHLLVRESSVVSRAGKEVRQPVE
jgi:DNA-binding LacI/PurR family transcriptional regulator